MEKIKLLMGKNFIGPEELRGIRDKIGILDPFTISGQIPEIPFDLGFLKEASQDYILILGMSGLTINKMREHLGWDPAKSEPCFYNQDWYLREEFAKDETLEFEWHLIKKEVSGNSRGKNPDELMQGLGEKESFPSAVLTAFTFFAYYFLTGGEILWKHDFIWCSDKDHNGDRIYTGRYLDPNGINKNGFNIHRHLSIKPCYGIAPQII